MGIKANLIHVIGQVPHKVWKSEGSNTFSVRLSNRWIFRISKTVELNGCVEVRIEVSTDNGTLMPYLFSKYDSDPTQFLFLSAYVSRLMSTASETRLHEANEFEQWLEEIAD